MLDREGVPEGAVTHCSVLWGGAAVEAGLSVEERPEQVERGPREHKERVTLTSQQVVSEIAEAERSWSLS